MSIVTRTHFFSLVSWAFTWWSFTPRSTYSNLGQDKVNGSLNPWMICRWRITERYPLIVPCKSPSSYRWATNVHRWSSESGNGVQFADLQRSQYQCWPLVYTLFVEGAKEPLTSSLAKLSNRWRSTACLSLGSISWRTRPGGTDTGWHCACG